MKQVVVLGGGFAGIAAVKALQKQLSPTDAKITLLDKNNYHLFTPSLYEVATSEEPKSNIAIPFYAIFQKRINVIQGSFEKIDAKKQIISYVPYSSTKQHELEYDYLVIALGSEPAYFHIPGLEENSITIKSLKDAILIKNKIQILCCEEGKCNKKVQVVIGGGGFSGTELAAELLTYKNILARQHHLDPTCLHITIIQGSERLLKELNSHVSKIAQERLQSPYLKIVYGRRISKVNKTSVFTDDNTVFSYDIFIWTGGVEANSILSKNGFPINTRGQVIVNTFLQVRGAENIFAAGDNTEFIHTSTKIPIPAVAQVAIDEGKIAGENIARLVKKQKLIPYSYFHLGYVVPLRGKFAAAELMGFFHFDGFLGWVLQQFIFLQYLLAILPFWKALKRWNTFELHLKQ